MILGYRAHQFMGLTFLLFAFYSKIILSLLKVRLIVCIGCAYTVRRSADIRGGDHHGNSSDSAQRADLRPVTAENHRRLFNV